MKAGPKVAVDGSPLALRGSRRRKVRWPAGVDEVAARVPGPASCPAALGRGSRRCQDETAAGDLLMITAFVSSWVLGRIAAVFLQPAR